MSYNGSGTFNINTAGQPVVTGTVISSTVFNSLTSDLATGLSTAITKDGQTTVTANIPFGGYKLTGVGAATTLGDALSYGRAATVTSLTDSGLTSGRVTYATTAGLLTDSANLTFNGTDLGLSVSQDGVTNEVITNASSGTAAQTRLRLNNGGSNFGAITHTGASFTTSGIFQQDGTYIYGNGTGGLALVTGATQPIYFGIANAEQMRLTSTGLGIGTSSPTKTLDVGGTVTASGAVTFTKVSGNVLHMGGVPGSSTANIYQSMFNQSGGFYLGAESSAGGTLVTSAPAYSTVLASRGTGGLVFSANNATSAQVILDASGNLGIQSTNPSSDSVGSVGGIVIGNGSGNKGITLFSSTSAQANIAFTDTAGSQQGLIQYDHGGDYMRFFTASTDRARIDSSGNFIIKGTGAGTNEAVDSLSFSGVSSGTPFLVCNSSSTGRDRAFFQYNGTTVGSIFATNLLTAYNTTSDYRLKNNQQALTGSGAFIDALKPKTWQWAADGSKGVGFIAHEFAEVSPSSVSGEKDATEIQAYEVTPAVAATQDEEGKELTAAIPAVMGEREVPKYQGMQASSSEVIANLVAEIQDLRKRLAALEAK